MLRTEKGSISQEKRKRLERKFKLESSNTGVDGIKEKIKAIVCFDKVYETGVKPIEEYIYNELNIDKVLITKITDSLPLIERVKN